MLFYHSLTALALQCLVAGTLAKGVEKRQETQSRSRVTLTRTKTHTATRPSVTAVTDSVSSSIPLTPEPTVLTTTIDGETLTFFTTIRRPCSECLSTSEAASSTGIIGSGSNTAEIASSEVESTASSALGEETSAASSIIDASTISIVLTTGSGESTFTSATGIFTNTTVGIPASSTFASTEETSTAKETSIILSTGSRGTSSIAESSAIFTNSTISATILPSTSNVITETTESLPAPTGGAGEIITRTVTLGGEVTTQTATVTATVGSPIIIIIQQITLFIFSSALGSQCPVVTPDNKGGFIVDGVTFPELGPACSSACYKQFAKCVTNAGKNFRVKDCQTQLGACMKAASTQTVTAAPVTVTRTVILPPDCSTASHLVSNEGSIISSKTITIGELVTIGTGGVSVVTATWTNVASETSVASSADATTIPETISQVETTEGVTVTQVDESGSIHISVVTMTLTIPAEQASETSVVRTASGSATTPIGSSPGVSTSASTSLVTMTLPPVDGTGTGQTSIVTLTISGGDPTGSSTGVVTSVVASESKSTASGVQTDGSGIPGSQTNVEVTSAQTSVVTMTIPASGSVSATVSTLTMTIPAEATSSAEAIESRSIHVSTNVVTVTIGDTTGIITITHTAPPVIETVTRTFQCGGKTTVTEFLSTAGAGSCSGGTKTVTVTQATCLISSGVREAATTTPTPLDPETVYVTETVEASATGADLVRRIRRGFGHW